MKESVNKSVDIIKLLIEEKKQEEENKIDYSSRLVNDVVVSYFKEYMEPMLIDLAKDNIVDYNVDDIKKNSPTRRTYLKA